MPRMTAFRCSPSFVSRSVCLLLLLCGVFFVFGFPSSVTVCLVSGHGLLCRVFFLCVVVLSGLELRPPVLVCRFSARVPKFSAPQSLRKPRPERSVYYRRMNHHGMNEQQQSPHLHLQLQQTQKANHHPKKRNLNPQSKGRNAARPNRARHTAHNYVAAPSVPTQSRTEQLTPFEPNRERPHTHKKEAQRKEKKKTVTSRQMTQRRVKK